MIGLLVVAVAMLAAGSVVARSPAATSRLAHLALAFPLGFVCLGLAGLAACVLAPPLSGLAATGLCAVAVIAGVLFGRPWPAASGWPCPRSPLERYASFAAVGAAVLVLAVSVSMPLVSVDGRILWTYHARLIADTGTYPAPELRDSAFLIAHPQYPPLLPMAEALAALVAGHADERALRTLATLLALAGVALLFAELPARDSRYGLLFAASFALLPTLIVFEEGGADSGVADAPLACLVLASVVALARGSPWAAGLLAGGAALTKNEGLVLGGLVCLSAWLPRRRRWVEGAVITSVFAAIVVPWLFIRAGLAAGTDERYLSRLTLAALSKGLPRGGELALEMLKTTFLLPHRAGLLPWLIAAFWITSPRRRAMLVEGRLWIVVVYLAAVWVVYVVSPWQGVIQVQLSFPRILLHVTPLALWGLTQPHGGDDGAMAAEPSD